MALFPLFLLVLGAGDISKIAILVWAAFFPTLLNTIQGVKNVDMTLIRSAQSMGISGPGMFAKVILPAASPYILCGLRLSTGVIWVVVVAAEMLGARAGLGYMIFTYEHVYMVPQMYVGIISLAIIGVVSNAILVRLENHITRWQEK